MAESFQCQGYGGVRSGYGGGSVQTPPPLYGSGSKGTGGTVRFKYPRGQNKPKQDTKTGIVIFRHSQRTPSPRAVASDHEAKLPPAYPKRTPTIPNSNKSDALQGEWLNNNPRASKRSQASPHAVAESMLALAVPAFSSGGDRVPGGLLLRTAPVPYALGYGWLNVPPRPLPRTYAFPLPMLLKRGIPGTLTKRKRIAPKGSRTLTPNERFRRACLWRDRSKAHDVIQQLPDPTAGLWLAPWFLQLLSSGSCLQAVDRKAKREPQQVTCSPPVTAPKPASDAALRLSFFSRGNRVIPVGNPVAPASYPPTNPYS